MRVLIFIYSLHGGGAERVAAELSTAWVEQGHEIILVTQTDNLHDAYDLHPRVQRRMLCTAGKKGRLGGVGANLGRIWVLRKILIETQPDIVLGMMTTSSILAVLAAQGLNPAVIATEHTHPPFQSLSKTWHVLRRWTYPRAKRVVALTQGTAHWIESNILGSRLTVIPNSVRWPLINRLPEVAPPARLNHRLRLLAVGRLHHDKGFDLLISAFALCATQYPSWDLIILGEGHARAAIEKQINACGLAQRISLPGRIGNIGDWYRSADLYVLSSRVEGLSNTLLEAMASGLPVVAYDCETGPREIIRDAVDGYLVRPNGSIAALAVALSKMMGNSTLRETLAHRAIEVRERFSVQNILNQWHNLFTEILA